MGVFDLFKGKEQKNETNIVYVSVNEVSVIIRPKIQKSDGKIIFYDLSGNRVPKIPRGKRDISIDHNCYLGLKKYKNSQRWEPIRSVEVEGYLKNKKFILDHSTGEKKSKKNKNPLLHQVLEVMNDNPFRKESTNTITFEKEDRKKQIPPDIYDIFSLDYIFFYEVVKDFYIENKENLLDNKSLRDHPNFKHDILFSFKSGIMIYDGRQSLGEDMDDDNIIMIGYLNDSPSVSDIVVNKPSLYGCIIEDEGQYSQGEKKYSIKKDKLDKNDIDNIISSWLKYGGKGFFNIKYNEIDYWKPNWSLEENGLSYHGGHLNIDDDELELFEMFLTTIIEKRFNYVKEKLTENQKIDLSRIKKLESSKNSILSEFDKDGNGIIDVIEGSDDFDKLFKKNQKKIIENDKTHIQQFVKISKYLRTKRNNIQETFKLITNSPKQESLDDLIGMLKNQIHTYEVLVFNSITMIVSIIEDDLITFYEIYELFDELNIFNSSFQNQVSDNLTEMNYKLGDLMYSIDSMEKNIVKGFKNLSYDLEGIKISLDTNLKGIQSSLDISNFINKFPNYPTYKLRNEYSKIPGLDFGGG